jgi:hypothetical protein
MLEYGNVVSCFQTKHKLNFDFALLIPSRRLRTTCRSPVRIGGKEKKPWVQNQALAGMREPCTIYPNTWVN